MTGHTKKERYKITNNPKYIWTLYHNDFPIGQGKSWHQALDILKVQVGITDMEVHFYTQYIQVKDTRNELYYSIKLEEIK